MDGGLLRILILGELGTRILGEYRRRHRRQEYAYIRVQAFLEVRRGTEPRRFLRAAITSRVFTSQSTQSQADPTTEEQSEEEIKKKNEVSQTAQSKHMCFPHRFLIPPDARPHGAVHCGKCPHTQTSGQCHRCGDLHRTQHQSNNGRTVFGNATSGFISARE